MCIFFSGAAGLCCSRVQQQFINVMLWQPSASLLLFKYIRESWRLSLFNPLAALSAPSLESKALLTHCTSSNQLPQMRRCQGFRV